MTMGFRFVSVLWTILLLMIRHRHGITTIVAQQQQQQSSSSSINDECIDATYVNTNINQTIECDTTNESMVLPTMIEEYDNIEIPGLWYEFDLSTTITTYIRICPKDSVYNHNVGVIIYDGVFSNNTCQNHELVDVYVNDIGTSCLYQSLSTNLYGKRWFFIFLYDGSGNDVYDYIFQRGKMTMDIDSYRYIQPINDNCLHATFMNPTNIKEVTTNPISNFIQYSKLYYKFRRWVRYEITMLVSVCMKYNDDVSFTPTSNNAATTTTTTTTTGTSIHDIVNDVLFLSVQRGNVFTINDCYNLDDVPIQLQRTTTITHRDMDMMVCSYITFIVNTDQLYYISIGLSNITTTNIFHPIIHNDTNVTMTVLGGISPVNDQCVDATLLNLTSSSSSNGTINIIGDTSLSNSGNLYYKIRSGLEYDMEIIFYICNENDEIANSFVSMQIRNDDTCMNDSDIVLEDRFNDPCSHVTLYSQRNSTYIIKVNVQDDRYHSIPGSFNISITTIISTRPNPHYFQWIDTKRNRVIGVITNHTQYSYRRNDIPTSKLNIEAIFGTTEMTMMSIIQSVYVTFDDPKRRHCEQYVPYSIFGDRNGTYRGISNISLGEHIVTATPYTRSSCQGIAGTKLITIFEIIE